MAPRVALWVGWGEGAATFGANANFEDAYDNSKTIKVKATNLGDLS